MKRHHYAWTICAAGTLLIFITMGAVSNGFSIYMPYIRDAYGLTNAQTSTLVTMRLVVAFVCMLLIGKYYDLLNIRLGAALAAASGGLAFIVYCFARNYLLFAVGAGISGLAYGLGSMVPVSILMSRWFDEHKALAISICSAGSGLGSVILPPVTTGLLSVLPMSTVFMLEGAFILALSLLIYALMRNYPTDMNLTRLGENRAKLSETAKEVLSNKKDKASITPAVMAIVCISSFLMGAQGNPGIMHLPVLFTSCGFTAVFTATLMSIIGAALTIGKVVYGELTDKIGGLGSSAVFMALLVLGNGLCCLSGTGSPALALSAVTLLGIGYSASTIGPSIWAGDLSSEMEFAKVIRRFQVAYSAGALIAASIPGIMADHAGGSYVPAYVFFTVLSAAASVLILLAYKKKK